LPAWCLLSSVVVFNDKQRCEQSLNEILGNHRRQPQQSRLEFGLGSQPLIPTANGLDC